MAKVKVTCYGETKTYPLKKPVIKFYTEAYYSCDPNSSEADRYLCILECLKYANEAVDDWDEAEKLVFSKI